MTPRATPMATIVQRVWRGMAWRRAAFARRARAAVAESRRGWARSSLSADNRFFERLIAHTENFGHLRWQGRPIWQNVLDLWTIQETICEVRPALLIECGTNRGGSALFYAHLFDLLGEGRILTIDVQTLHDVRHPRIEFLYGSSTAPAIIDRVAAAVRDTRGPVMVILDSDHSADHVARELESYARFVTPGSFLLVQDGIIDVLPSLAADRPGPLVAIRQFVARHPEFEVDTLRCERFLITHHPSGWLRRR